ncbi:MAG TPA: polysaccharide deacetylase family protein [Chitinophaga sp.]
MQALKKAYYGAIKAVPLGVLKKVYPGGPLLPYHNLVSNEEVPHIRHLYGYKTVQGFERDLDYLLRHFQPVGIPALLQAVKSGTPLPDNTFLLTFDDGLREVSSIIAPILLRKGVPAAFFLNPAYLDNHRLFYKFKISLAIDALLQRAPGPALRTALAGLLAPLAPEKPPVAEVPDLVAALRRITYRNQSLAEEAGKLLELDFADYATRQAPVMRMEEVGQLVQQGFAIGGHSMDHPYYRELTPEQQLQQTLDSVNLLQERFALNYRLFAFPHTDAGVPRSFFDTLLGGATPSLDLVFGTANQRKDIYPGILHRFNAERPQWDMAGMLKGVMAYNTWRNWQGKNALQRS